MFVMGEQRKVIVSGWMVREWMNGKEEEWIDMESLSLSYIEHRAATKRSVELSVWDAP